MVICVQPHRGTVGFGRPCPIATSAHIPAHQIVLQNIRQRSLGRRGVGVQLYRLTGFGPRRLAHPRLKQHLGHLQVVDGIVGVLRGQAAIGGQRLANLAFMQKHRTPRLEVDQNRRPRHQLRHLVPQLGCLGRCVSPIDGIKNQTRRDHAVLLRGKLLGQQRRAYLNRCVRRQIPGYKPVRRHNTVLPFGTKGLIQLPVRCARLLGLVLVVFLLLVRVVLALQIIGQKLEQTVQANCGYRAIQVRIASLGLFGHQFQFKLPRKVCRISALQTAQLFGNVLRLHVRSKAVPGLLIGLVGIGGAVI